MDCELECYVFKTNIESEIQIDYLKPFLNHIVSCNRWNFDLEDIDKVFRLIANQSEKADVEKLFVKLSFYIEELHYYPSEILN